MHENTAAEQASTVDDDAPGTVAQLRAELARERARADMWEARFDIVRRAVVAAGDDPLG